MVVPPCELVNVGLDLRLLGNHVHRIYTGLTFFVEGGLEIFAVFLVLDFFLFFALGVSRAGSGSVGSRGRL